MNRLRSGAALIIVLLILVALLLIGLPFLYSQVWGLSGARSAQAAQAARVYLLGAEHLGAALGAYANTSVWSRTTGIVAQTQVHTALEQYLADGMPTPTGLDPVDPEVATTTATRNRARIDAAAFGWNHGPSVQVGLEISDEAGRLDPNLMDAAAWKDLFIKLDIPDWDDQEVTPPITWAIGDGADADDIGELANQLEWYRIHGARYERIEDLRIPSPQQSGRRIGTYWQFRKRLNAAEIQRLRPFLAFHNLGQGRAGLTDLGSVVASDQTLAAAITDPRYRPTQVWLDIPTEVVNHGTWVQAEPTPGTAAVEGLVRLGTNATGFSTTISYKNGQLPAQLSGIWLQVPPLLNVNQVVPEIGTLPAYKYAAQDPGGGAPTEFPDRALLPITWYGQQNPSGTPSDSALPWDYLQPRFRTAANQPYRERQPLDLRSDGLIRIAAAATVLNAAGAVAAQGQRTTIVQTLPQEQMLERRWLTQGQFEPLVAQRFTSGMSTWPRATARARDLQPADTDPATATSPVDETGLAFTVRPSPAAFVPGAIPHLAIDWRAPLGSNAPSTQAEVLKDYRVPVGGGAETRVDPETTGGLMPPSLTQANGEGLFPDGVRLGSGNQLAYRFDQTSGGPLRMADPSPTNAPTDTSPRDSSLAFRHIGFWFRPETNWSSGAPTDVITLLEARPHPTIYGQFRFADDLNQTVIPHGTGVDQNYFGVFYDPKQNMLVAAYTPPSATATAQPLTSAFTAAIDDPTGTLTPWVDERCMPGAADQWLTPARLDANTCRTWSETFTPNRIMTCWKFGRRLDASGTSIDNVPEQGRWYHLQLIIGNGRPGGIGIVVDGLAGTDVGRMPAKQYLDQRRTVGALKGPWPGDHLTIPSLLLREDLLAIEKRDAVGPTAGTDGSDFYLDKIAVEMPGFAPFDTNDYSGTPPQVLTPQHTLPSRGTVLIGDEYIRYESILPAATGTDPYRFELKDCTRGFRQDTWADSTTMLERFPTTEDHKAGDRVITDGCRIPLEGNLYRGGGMLKTDFASGPFAVDESGRDVDFAITGTIQEVDDGAARPFSAPITVVGAAWALAPADGFLLLRDSTGSSYIYFYTRDGATLQLEDPAATFSAPMLVASVPADPPHQGTYWSRSGANRARVTLISLELDDSADLTNNAFWRQPNGISRREVLAQLLGVDGWCEWVRYTDIIRRRDATGNRGFLLNREGWSYDSTTTNRQRGKERTAFRDSTYGPFPAGTSRVLPVQTSVTYPYTKILAPGDLITFVPRNYAAAAPAAAVVRYSANDGYGPTPDAVNDTINGWLGFTAPLRDLLVSGAAYEIVMGTGLNTLRDLTPLSNAVTNLATAALPRLDSHASGTDAGRLVFGGQDVGRGGAPNPDLSGTDLPVMTIDAPYAGPWANSAGRLLRVYFGGTAGAGIAATGDLPLFVEADKPVFDRAGGTSDNLSLLEIGGEVFACELLRDTDLPAVITAMETVRATYPELHGGSASAAWLASNRAFVARLVGRGLLGSTSLAHRFSASPFGVPTQLTTNQRNRFGNLDLGPEFLRLPVGPVRYLTDPAALAANDWFTMHDVVRAGASVVPAQTRSFIAPVALIADPVRADADPATAQHEALVFIGHDERQMLKGWDPATSTWIDIATNPNAGKWIIASWLRGLYNTPSTIAWAPQSGGRDQLDPLVIGWWPRFASALPSASGSAPTPLTAQHFRSRVYTWVNLPLRLHNARFCDQAPPELAFDPDLPANAVLAGNNVPGSDPSLTVELRAMAGSIGGRRDVRYALNEGSGTQGDWSLNGGNQFTALSAAGSAVTGLFPWNPSTTPDSALETDGVEVRISFRYIGDAASDLSSIARSANRSPLLSAAKLRCYAPLTTIAVEGNR